MKMRDLRPLIGFFLAAAALSLRAAEPTGPAERDVRARLAQSGIPVGADAASGRYVFIGTCSRKVPNPAADPKFLRTRRECAEVAELSAKRDILCAVRMRINAKDQTSVESDGDSTARITESVMEVLAGEPLSGASIVASTESWDVASGQYQVAVAVAWTKKLVAGATDAVPPSARTTDEEDKAEWKRWLADVDLSIALGMRQFVDSHGRRRFAGIGCADVEGKPPAARNAARIVAETEAKASLALGLYGDSEMRNLAISRMAEMEGAGGAATVDAWETFVGRIRVRCRNRQIRGGTIHSEVVVHPVTGRQMIVCVYGMTAADQAEMNLLNNTH